MRFKSIILNTIVVFIGPLVTEAQTISDIRVSNEAAFSVSIGWVTDIVSKGHVLFGHEQPGARVDDIRGAEMVDDVHYVRIEGLEPETSYMFEVVSGGSVVRDLSFTTLAVNSMIPPELNLFGRIATSGADSKPPWQKNYMVAWGLKDFGQTDVPRYLPEITSIGAGRLHSLALKSDSMMVAWGDNTHGQVDVPGSLTGVTAIAGGG
ncbi:uncharacterized protein METZ01_LOCUS256225, partial [marine metagenome]